MRYEEIYEVVRQIPPGKVATYGQVAAIIGPCTARMVGYALAALPQENDVPWQRVINRQGKVSPRGDGWGSLIQRRLLTSEGVEFEADKVNFTRYGWAGPPLDWLSERGYQPPFLLD